MALYAVATPSVETLTDVLVTNRTTGDILEWNGSAWVNVPGSSIVSGYVPYTGATSNVNLGAFNLICAEVLTDTVIAENLYFNSVPYDVMVCTSVTSGQLTAVTIGANLSFSASTLSVTGAALTKTDDTNVTLTLGGTPTSALLKATSLTLGWTGTLAATRGGTGFGSYAVGDILYANTTTSLAKLADVATGNVLLSGGVGVAPSWGKVSASSAITGVLPIANGGTNASSQTSNGICYYDGSKITTSAYATLSFIAGDIDLLITHPSVVGTVYEIAVTSSSCQYIMSYNIASTFQGICGTAATENYWTLSTKGLGLSVSASALWFGSTSNDDVSFYRNNTEKLRLTSTGIYVPDVISVGTTTALGRIYTVDETATPGRWYFDQYRSSSGVYSGATFRKARNTAASPTSVINGDTLGSVEWYGHDGSSFLSAASILALVDNTTGTNDMPTALTFRTTSDGAATTTERVRFSSSGSYVSNCNFGVTTSSSAPPVRLFHVIDSANGTGTNAIFMQASGGSMDVVGWDGTDYNNINLRCQSSTQLYLTTTGRVGIGTSTPANLLSLANNNYLAWRNAANGAETVGITSSASDDLQFYVGSGTKMTILSSGYVGIGTTNPGAKFHVYGSGNEKIALTNSSLTSPDRSSLGIDSSEGFQILTGRTNSNHNNFTLRTGDFDNSSSARLTVLGASGNVGIGTNNPSRKLTVSGGASLNDQLLYLKQANDYGYSFNLDSSSTGRMYLYGVNAGVETSAIMTFDRTNTYVGVNASPSYRFHVNENQAYSSRNANPLPAQLVVQSGATGFLKIGNYYTGGVGTCSAIQSTDLFSGADHGVNLLLNPLGGNVGIGEDTPNFTLVARYTSTNPQISARYDGTSPSNYKELHLAYNGATGSGYGWIQAIHNGTAYTPLCLNPYGGYVGIGTLSPEEILHIAKSGSGTIGARILLDNTASPATNNACEIGFLTDGGASVSSYNANIKAVQDGSGTGYTALTFGTYNGGGTPAERVRISPAGDVSIGIAASARAKLEVAGDIWTDWNDRFIGTVYQTGSAYKMGFATTTAVRALDLIAMSADNSAIRFWTGSTPSVNAYIDNLSNVVLGNQSALATNATNGFVYIRTCAGTPTGAPTAFTGHVAIVYDTTNNKLYAYNGSWRSVTLT